MLLFWLKNKLLLSKMECDTCYLMWRMSIILIVELEN